SIAAQRTMSGWKQGPVPAIGRRPPGGARHARGASHPPGTAPPVTQGIPAAAPGKTAHGTGRGASNDRCCSPRAGPSVAYGLIVAADPFVRLVSGKVASLLPRSTGSITPTWPPS